MCCVPGGDEIMTMELTRSMLAWCSVINIGLLLLWSLIYILAHDWMCRLHGRWFAIPVDRFDTIHYAGMGLFKLGIILFNLVPYLALRIVG